LLNIGFLSKTAYSDIRPTKIFTVTITLRRHLAPRCPRKWRC